MFLINRIARGKKLLAESKSTNSPTKEQRRDSDRTPDERESKGRNSSGKTDGRQIEKSRSGSAKTSRSSEPLCHSREVTPRPSEATQPDLAKLSVYQRRALLFTWRKLYSHDTRAAEHILVGVFERVERRWPSGKMRSHRAFGGGAYVGSAEGHCRRHGRHLACTIDGLISSARPRNYHCPSEIGEMHRHLKGVGMKADAWELFGESLLEVLWRQEGVRDYPGGSRAWLVFIAAIVDEIRASFDSARSVVRSQTTGAMLSDEQRRSYSRSPLPRYSLGETRAQCAMKNSRTVANMTQLSCMFREATV